MDGMESKGAAAAETSGIGASAALGREWRMTAGRKRDAVLRLFRGEPLEIVARELAVTAADQGGRADNGQRAASFEDRAAAGRGRRPFWRAEVEAMSAVVLISTRRRHGVARACRVWNVPRAGICRGSRVIASPTPRRRPGPQGPMPDAALVEAIRGALLASPFHGEGYGKVWARLRHGGLRTSKERVRRLMRENGLSAAARTGRPTGPRSHDGTIIPEKGATRCGART